MYADYICVTTTASCEAFCEACLFLSIYFRQCKGLFSGRGARWEPKWPIFDPLPENGEMAKNSSCFLRWLLLLIFQLSRPLSGNAPKKKKAFRTPPAHVPTMPSDDEDALRLQRQIRRAVAETCGPAGIRDLSAQDETAAYVQLLPCGQHPAGL